MLPSFVLAAAVTASQATSEAVAVSGGSGVTILLLMIGGILLVFFEAMVPGGFLGALGAVLFASAVIIAFNKHGGQTAVVVLLVAVVASVAAIIVGWTYLPKTRFAEKIFLTPSRGQVLPPVTPDAIAKAGVRAGDRGVSLSDLRPAGLARIGDWRLDVVTRGEYIDIGTPVVVVAMDGTRVVVRADSPGPPPAETA